MRQSYYRMLLVFAFLFNAMPSLAEEQQKAAPIQTDQLEEFVQKIENKERRDALINDLRALIALQRAKETSEEPAGFGQSLLQDISTKIERIGHQAAAAAEAVLQVPVFWEWLTTSLGDEDIRRAWFFLLGKIALVIMAGIFAEALTRISLVRVRISIEQQITDNRLIRLFLVIARSMLDILAIAAFAASAYGALVLLALGGDGRIAAITLIQASILARSLCAIAKTLLAPRVAVVRLLPLHDETANYLFVWTKRLTYLIVYGYFILEAALLLGFPVALHQAVLKVLGLAIALLTIMIILQNRRMLSGVFRKQDAYFGALLQWIAETWHILATIYIAAVYCIWALELPGGFEFVLKATGLSIVVLFTGKFIYLALDHAIARGFALNDDIKAKLPGLEARTNLYLPAIQRTAKAIIVAIVVLTLLQIWGLEFITWLLGKDGRMLLGKLVAITLVVTMALAIWEITSAMVQRYLTASDAEGNAIQRGQRAQTLLPLFRNFLLLILIAIVTITILSEIGVNIGPLLAGAGVVGLAIGFGAQTLVKDIITGLFILIEDTISVGDVVELGSHTGLVEAMSIRSIQLRDVAGEVHRIPFSDVSSVINKTKDFSRALLDVGVSYRENVDEVMEVLRGIGAEMREDENFAPFILEDIEILGLQRFDDSAVIIRARFKTKPRRQWGVTREFNRRLKNRFDELGIEIPFPARSLYFGEDKSGNANPLRISKDDIPLEKD
jgi:small-conductance mechanosensitive channel